MEIREKIKGTGVKLGTKEAKSIMELLEKGYSGTGVSTCDNLSKKKKNWTKETSIGASLLWPNLVKLGNHDERKEFVKVTNESRYAKILTYNGIHIVDFEFSYSNKYWNRLEPGELNVVVKSQKETVVDSAKRLANLILERETEDLEPFIVNGNITGRIRLNGRDVEYSMFRDIHLGINEIMFRVGYGITGKDKIDILENIKEIIFVNDEGGCRSIEFRYKNDFIADGELVNEIKKEMLKKIQEGVKSKKAIFKRYGILYIRRVNHFLEPHWSDNPESRFFKIIIDINFRKEIKDVKYGVLFRL